MATLVSSFFSPSTTVTWMLLMALGGAPPDSWDTYGFLTDETELRSSLLSEICGHLLTAGVLGEGTDLLVPLRTGAVFRIVDFRRSRTTEAIGPGESEIEPPRTGTIVSVDIVLELSGSRPTSPDRGMARGRRAL